MSRSPWEVAASAITSVRQSGAGGDLPTSNAASMSPRVASVLPIHPRPALRAEDLAPQPRMMGNEHLAGGKDADWRRVLMVGKATRSKRKASGEGDDAEGRARPMTSSERGIKFRKKQQERQQRLLCSTETLRREIARLEALKDLREGSALITSFTEGGAPMKFALEYFALFRAGVPLQGGGERDDAFVLKQEMFLSEMLDPAMCFCGKPALPELIAQWRVKVAAHASIRVERSSSHLVTTDNCATVVSKGFMHMRYARRTIEKMYPHAVANEELVQKLIGRMLHMPFRSKMYFNERGKLDRLEIEPDLFTALYGVLRDLRECELLLGKTRMPKLLTNEVTAAVTVLEPAENSLPVMAMMAVPGPENDARETASQSPRAAIAAASTASMNLEFILS